MNEPEPEPAPGFFSHTAPAARATARKARAESMSARAAAYQAEVTGARNGLVYMKNGVKFDGVLDGVLVEAKGPGYQNFIDKVGEFFKWFTGRDSMLDQAARQVEAARPPGG